MATSSAAIKVAIVGGGIAGLTAALRLTQNGCKVTVYEKDARVGGNLGGDLGACPRNGGFWWRRLRESDSACL